MAELHHKILSTSLLLVFMLCSSVVLATTDSTPSQKLWSELSSLWQDASHIGLLQSASVLAKREGVEQLGGWEIKKRRRHIEFRLAELEPQVEAHSDPKVRHLYREIGWHLDRALPFTAVQLVHEEALSLLFHAKDHPLDPLAELGANLWRDYTPAGWITSQFVEDPLADFSIQDPEALKAIAIEEMGYTAHPMSVFLLYEIFMDHKVSLADGTAYRRYGEPYQWMKALEALGNLGWLVPAMLSSGEFSRLLAHLRSHRDHDTWLNWDTGWFASEQEFHQWLRRIEERLLNREPSRTYTFARWEEQKNAWYPQRLKNLIPDMAYFSMSCMGWDEDPEVFARKMRNNALTGFVGAPCYRFVRDTGKFVWNSAWEFRPVVRTLFMDEYDPETWEALGKGPRGYADSWLNMALVAVMAEGAMRTSGSILRARARTMQRLRLQEKALAARELAEFNREAGRWLWDKGKGPNFIEPGKPGRPAKPAKPANPYAYDPSKAFAESLREPAANQGSGPRSLTPQDHAGPAQAVLNPPKKPSGKTKNPQNNRQTTTENTPTTTMPDMPAVVPTVLPVVPVRVPAPDATPATTLAAPDQEAPIGPPFQPDLIELPLSPYLDLTPSDETVEQEPTIIVPTPPDGDVMAPIVIDDVPYQGERLVEQRNEEDEALTVPTIIKAENRDESGEPDEGESPVEDEGGTPAEEEAAAEEPTPAEVEALKTALSIYMQVMLAVERFVRMGTVYADSTDTSQHTPESFVEHLMTSMSMSLPLAVFWLFEPTPFDRQSLQRQLTELFEAAGLAPNEPIFAEFLRRAIAFEIFLIRGEFVRDAQSETSQAFRERDELRAADPVELLHDMARNLSRDLMDALVSFFAAYETASTTLKRGVKEFANDPKPSTDSMLAAVESLQKELSQLNEHLDKTLESPDLNRAERQHLDDGLSRLKVVLERLQHSIDEQDTGRTMEQEHLRSILSILDELALPIAGLRELYEKVGLIPSGEEAAERLVQDYEPETVASIEEAAKDREAFADAALAFTEALMVDEITLECIERMRQALTEVEAASLALAADRGDTADTVAYVKDVRASIEFVALLLEELETLTQESSVPEFETLVEQRLVSFVDPNTANYREWSELSPAELLLRLFIIDESGPVNPSAVAQAEALRKGLVPLDEFAVPNTIGYGRTNWSKFARRALDDLDRLTPRTDLLTPDDG